MSSYQQIFYHIIFRTKNSEKTLPLKDASKLYAYIFGFIKSKKCHLYRVNGMEDHIHILTDLHPNLALANFMRDLKTSSSLWLKQQEEFKHFKGWADGYAALTKSVHEKEQIINYIKNQQIHHIKEDFHDEFTRLLKENEIKVDDKYFL